MYVHCMYKPVYVCWIHANRRNFPMLQKIIMARLYAEYRATRHILPSAVDRHTVTHSVGHCVSARDRRTDKHNCRSKPRFPWRVALLVFSTSTCGLCRSEYNLPGAAATVRRGGGGLYTGIHRPALVNRPIRRTPLPPVFMTFSALHLYT